MTTGTGKPSAKNQRQADALRELALAFPEAHEDHPWGHSAFKVKQKTFVFVSADERGLGVSLKLVASHAEALALPFTEPTGYGLGKHGWVSASFGPADEVPLEQIEQWITESYRAVAPKTILKRLDLPPPGPGPERAAQRGPAAAGRATRSPSGPQPVAKTEQAPRTEQAARKRAATKQAPKRKSSR